MHRLEPAGVLWFDDENSRFVECDTECGFETILVVDCSESMKGSDATYADFSFGYRTSTRRKDICEAFFSRVDATNKQGFFSAIMALYWQG